MSDFIQNRPMPLAHIFNSPSILRYFLKERAPGLPHPSLRGIKQLALFCGHTDQAFRTQVSRSKKKKEITLENCEGIKRMIVDESVLHYSEYYQNRQQEQSYTLVLFSFPTGEAKKRYNLKEALKNLNFTQVNPNAYLGYGLDHEKVEILLSEYGFADNILLFPSITEIPRKTLEKMKENFDLTRRENEIKDFDSQLQDFFQHYPPGSEERLLALLAASVSLYSNLVLTAPNLPDSLFAARNVIDRMNQDLFTYVREEADELILQYQSIFGK